MEAALGHLGFGICTPKYLPTPSPLNSTKKPPRLNAVNGGLHNFSANKWADRLISDFHFLPNADSATTTTPTLNPPPYPNPPALAPHDRLVDIPLDFYRVLGAEDHFLSESIKRCYEDRVSKPPLYGYSQDALISRRQILQAACETLAKPSSRREYNQHLAEDELDAILTQVPWDNVIVLHSIHFFFLNARLSTFKCSVIGIILPM